MKKNLKEKIYQMFILGFDSTELNKSNLNIQNAIKNGLGGVILFSENINSTIQVKKLTGELQKIAKNPLFISIDQEGGLVQRNIFSADKIDYLSQMALAQTESLSDIEVHTQIIANELKSMGINMNFSPDLDVNTNPLNPVIGIRSFGSDTEMVVRYSAPVYKTFQKNNIIAVGKHFPGHGEAFVDSHLDLPRIDIDIKTLENIHIKPFKSAVENGLDAVMMAHVDYSCFKGNEPASLSKEVIDYLKSELGFNGLVISDDMVMGGVSKHYNLLDACIMGINAGIDMFIFRYSDDLTIDIIEKLENAVLTGQISEEKINKAYEKIIALKLKYDIGNIENVGVNVDLAQKTINEIALDSIKVEKKGDLMPFNENLKTLILKPDFSTVFNLSKDDFSLNLKFDKEIIYPLNISDKEIQEIKCQLPSYNQVIFISYNAIFNQGQVKLFEQIDIPSVCLITGNPEDKKYFQKADSILISSNPKPPSIKALIQVLTQK